MKLRKHPTSLLALLAALLLLFTACAPQAQAPEQTPAPEVTKAPVPSEEPVSEEPAASFTPGTYTATTQGNNGPLTVSVTFTNDSIASIEVTDCVETTGLGVAAIEKLQNEILTSQSLGVDLVTGATYSSGAFLTCVTDCVKQAGGDAAALREVPLVTDPVEDKSFEADLVVVGGGSAGMICATKAAQAGLDVILLEKMPYTGGASMIAGGGMVITGSALQKKLGVTDDSPESLIEDFLANGSNKNDMLLLGLYANNIGAAVDWAMANAGVQYNEENGLGFAAEYSHNRVANVLGGSANYAATLRRAMEDSGAVLMLETRAQKLLTDASGAVTGVEAVKPNGSVYTFNAKAVVLATGGFGNNVDMLSDDMKTVLYYGPMSSTGDGQQMAKEVGAQFQLMEYGKRYPNGVEVSPRIGKSTIYGGYASFDVSGILVNKAGERVVNERASNKTVLTAQLSQPERQLYLVMDAATYDAFFNNLYKNGITQTDLDHWIANEGKVTPVLVKGDTIEAAAALAGIDGAALQATVERYNTFVQNGVDEDFGRSTDYMTAQIGAGPYYIIEQKPRFATTMGSLVTTESLQVLNESNEVIPNLYAAGEVVNGVHGDDSPSGANLGWALTSGYLAADTVIAACAK